MSRAADGTLIQYFAWERRRKRVRWDDSVSQFFEAFIRALHLSMYNNSMACSLVTSSALCWDERQFRAFFCRNHTSKLQCQFIPYARLILRSELSADLCKVQRNNYNFVFKIIFELSDNSSNPSFTLLQRNNRSCENNLNIIWI